MTPRIAIIGGSGLYRMEQAELIEELRVDTPFGAPSDALMHVRLHNPQGGAATEALFLPRHGRGHRLTPSEVPYRANFWALKSLGIEYVIAVSACGSLREEIVPGHLVVVDQYIDRTRGRVSTFFGDGIVAHVGFAEPTCALLGDVLKDAARQCGVTFHDRGTYLCMEGPAFSTRAESRMYRAWGADVIGMTNLPEAKLAREAEMSYASLAMATDYDAWREGEAHVEVDEVIRVLNANVRKAQDVILAAAPRVAALGPSPYAKALDLGLMSDLGAASAEARSRLRPILRRVAAARGAA